VLGADYIHTVSQKLMRGAISQKKGFFLIKDVQIMALVVKKKYHE
jgi:hypothetical protein